MLIKEIIENPFESLKHMERYVNDGSPSGFSFNYSTSKKYSPVEGIRKFELPVFWSDEVRTYGTIPNNLEPFFFVNGERAIPFHPDNISDFPSLQSKIKNSTFEVSPTASPRTLFAELKNSFYLKLHYKGVLGRIQRAMPFRKAITEVEISTLLIDEILSEGNTNFGIFQSPFCNYFSDNETIDFSFILRQINPFPVIRTMPILIPCFSLFSADRFNEKDQNLLIQILEMKDGDDDYFLDNFIFPVLRMYINLSKNHGLIPELNAQNLVYEFDDKFNFLRPVLRDFMEIEKDITIRSKLNFKIDFDSISYKTISSLKEDYFIRHSFSFDFKLTHYVILPLVKLYCSHYKVELNKILSIVRDFVFTEWGQEIYNHFKPFENWYDVPNQLLVIKSDRKYNTNINPILR